MIGGIAAAAVSVLLVATGSAGATTVAGPSSRTVFRFADTRIDEASGIGLGIASPGVVYVQNDSGDSARFFALDATSGATLAVYTVPGARNVDWEDLAVAPDARGVPSVWLADIGDNDAARSEVRIYRVDEPLVDRHRLGLQLTTASPSVWRLRYPDGPMNAEGLAVAPGGASYVVTKSFLGDSSVYAVPAEPDPARVQALRRIAGIQFSLTGTPGGPSVVGELTATGAALSADGRVLAVRTYTDAYVWPVSEGDVAAALRGAPVRTPLPAQAVGEGIAIRGSTLLVDSEGVGSTVYSVAMPPLSARSLSARSPSAAPTSPVQESGRPDAAGSSTDNSPSSTPTRRPWYVVGVFLLVIAGIAVIIVRRRRRRR